MGMIPAGTTGVVLKILPTIDRVFVTIDEGHPDLPIHLSMERARVALKVLP